MGLFSSQKLETGAVIPALRLPPALSPDVLGVIVELDRLIAEDAANQPPIEPEH